MAHPQTQKFFFQVDGLDNNFGLREAKRYKLKKTQKPRSEWTEPSSELIEELGEINTGDPKVFSKFLTWGLADLGDRRVAVILWNHGTGIIDFVPDNGSVKSVFSKALNGAFFTQPMKSFFRSLLSTSSNSIKSIATDVSSGGDALETLELKEAIEYALSASDVVDKIDLLVFDACFMASLELMYELHQRCAFIVASSAVMPSRGLPYDRILEDLAKNENIFPEEFGRLIVENYGKEYRTRSWFVREPITLSCVSLAEIEEVVAKLEKLITYIIDFYKEDKIKKFICLGLIKEAWKVTVEKFGDRNFIDLFSWMSQIKAKVLDQPSHFKPGLDADIEQLLDLIISKAIKSNVSFVRRDYSKPPPPIDSRGCTIFVPVSTIGAMAMEKYRLLAFSRNGVPHWPEFLDDFV